MGEPAKFSCHTFAQTGSAALTQSEESAEQFFELQTESNKEYWRRLGVAAPDWTGKRVLDVGCGLGALSIEMAQAGASVLGVDLDENLIAFANRKVAQEFPQLLDRVTFRAADAMSLPVAEPFDVIVSKDTFEHAPDVASLLKALDKQLARPQGILYAGFSPLYYSPYGDHGRTGLKVPWAHAVLPKRVVYAAAARHNGHPVGSLLDIGLNGNTPDQFRAAFDDSGLRIIRLAYNCGDKRLLPVLEKARKRFRRLDRFTTVSIYAVFAV
ncbi:SAM-dependent methyltransferase [Mycobacterium kansasii]|nr:SAM-dependent methyltransferase [Mycobacterium kansasii]ARG72903.1 SAM-dependent methyltransferase [Mycobacterium kansasii]ARG78089.1 SAM-dependent methyltransferase [Mycobacterium kansasii]ARG83542.1 SAM-dependent methyltransferase [Mycobacterium kansasii]ARG95646.1 SAM-dependent methyltransferase [Mycobacterium kansasii]